MLTLWKAKTLATNLISFDLQYAKSLKSTDVLEKFSDPHMQRANKNK